MLLQIYYLYMKDNEVDINPPSKSNEVAMRYSQRKERETNGMESLCSLTAVNITIEWFMRHIY